MKVRWMLLPLAALTVAAAVYGGYIRATLTDYTSGENWEENFQVAEMPEQLMSNTCALAEKYLPTAPYILRVEALGTLEAMPGMSQQRVKVKQVYSGSGLEMGDEIYLYSIGWSVSFL